MPQPVQSVPELHRKLENLLRRQQEITIDKKRQNQCFRDDLNAIKDDIQDTLELLKKEQIDSGV